MTSALVATAVRTGHVSRARVSRLVSLTSLAPEIQGAVLDLHLGGPLGRLSQRTLHEVVAVHADWRVQRRWWALLAQRFEPRWLAEWVPARTEFPSGITARADDRAIGDLPLTELAELVARRRGTPVDVDRRENLLVALAGDASGAPTNPAVAIILATLPATLAAEFLRLHGHPPASRPPDYVRRRVAWAVQATKEGGLPKPISGKVMVLKEHLPKQWQEVFADVARVHVTRVHRIERRDGDRPRADLPGRDPVGGLR